MQVRLLGPITATVGHRDVDLGSPRQRAVFSVLAMNPGRVVSREEMIDAVWGTSPPVTVESSVYTYIARLRRRFEPDREHRTRSKLLINEGAGYCLQIGPEQVDAHTFTRLLEQARKHELGGRHCMAVRDIDSALTLWAGPPLGGSVGPYTEVVRHQLTETYFAARQDRADFLLHLGRSAEAIAELSELVRWQPLQERLRRLRMLAYYRTGRRADALAEFREIRRLLIAELGVEPGEDLQRCHEQILRSDPVLDAVAPVPPNQLTAVPARRVGTAPAQLPRDVPGFTGRRTELRHLHTLLHNAEAAGESAVLTVTGRPRVGKSALAIRFAHELSARFPDGHLYLDLAGSGRQLPATEAMVLLMADLGGNRPLPIAVDRIAALYRSMLWGKRILIVLDDAACTAQVPTLLPGSPSCVVIVTSRDPLTALAARDGARGIRISALPEVDAVNLVKRIAGRPADDTTDDDAIRLLVRECDGLPLAVRVATERILAQQGRSLTEGITDLLSSGSLLDVLEADHPEVAARHRHRFARQGGRVHLRAATNNPRPDGPPAT